MRNVYLDHTATTPLDPEVFEAMRPYFMEKFGNASSIHHFGQEAKAALDESREKIASLIGAKAGELFFVGSGTEADNTALKGVAWEMQKEGRTHIITSKIEHHAILETAEFLSNHGFEISYVDVNRHGMVAPEQIRSMIRPQTCLISVMHANNEIGTIQPVQGISEIVREHGICFHADAVQTFGKIPCNVDELGVDLLSLSAHKIYGPKGIGALYIRKGTRVERFIHGGKQERGRRAGTENVAFAVGFAKAAELMFQHGQRECERLLVLKSYLADRLRECFPYLMFNGHPEESLPHILNVSFDSSRIDIDGESLLFNLDLAGIAVTSGSACTSGSMEASHVLRAIGRDEMTAKASIRFSMGKSTTREDLDYTIDALNQAVRKIGKIKNLQSLA